MDCNCARLLLMFAGRDRTELEAGDRAQLEQHLASCPECGPAAHADSRHDELLARAMTAVPIADGARARLERQISAARSRWWRQTTLRLGALGVGSVLAVTLVYSSTRPMLDLSAAAAEANSQSGLWKSDGQALTEANEQLRALGAPAVAPADFDYRWLKRIERSDSHGVYSAPTLYFTRDDAYAKVVLVSVGQFKNLRELADLVGEESGCWVAIRPVPDHSRLFFVITSYGKPLQFFLRKTPVQNPA